MVGLRFAYITTVTGDMGAGEPRKAYPTDLTDKQWRAICPFVISDAPIGRKRLVDLREIVNAILYRRHSRCPWRMLPHDYPQWETVYYYYRRWQSDGTLETICSFAQRT